MPDTHRYIFLVLGQTHLMHGGPFNIYQNQNLHHQLPLKAVVAPDTQNWNGEL